MSSRGPTGSSGAGEMKEMEARCWNVPIWASWLRKQPRFRRVVILKSLPAPQCTRGLVFPGLSPLVAPLLPVPGHI